MSKIPKKLNMFELNLPDWLIKWIAAYLSNRKQRIRINEIETEWKPAKAGVIQGSVPGPVLFMIFIADINSRRGSPMVPWKRHATQREQFQGLHITTQHLLPLPDLTPAHHQHQQSQGSRNIRYFRHHLVPRIKQLQTGTQTPVR